jgi:hypothetical protein
VFALVLSIQLHAQVIDLLAIMGAAFLIRTSAMEIMIVAIKVTKDRTYVRVLART